MPGGAEDPLRVAIIGSGPSGFYAAGNLLKAKDTEVQVDVFDRLPTPWGLVRGGVAPDHPNIKAVSRVYEKTAALPGFRFFGNVHFGEDVTHDELADRYHAIVYATGAQTDRRMGIRGEDLPGSHSATDFVAWYNGHPDYSELEFDLSAETAVVVGNGNVAMDVTRMLATDPEELAKTDCANYALEALRESRVREVIVLGRRGPAQAAFTNPELLELAELTRADVYVDPADCELDEHSAQSLEGEGNMTARKNVEILTGYSTAQPSGSEHRIHLRFLVSPVEILGSEAVEGVRIVRNELHRGEDGVVRPEPTDLTDVIECGLVFRSIGYRGVPLDGVPFDEQGGVVPNERGRVADGEYVVGWIKRGPSGIIGTNKRDAKETVDVLLEDAAAGRLLRPTDADPDSLEQLLRERKPDHVTYEGWEAIDRAEREAGEAEGRPRVKLTRTEALLEAAREKVG
jgi:ferredoxin--NADP+ reductase